MDLMQTHPKRYWFKRRWYGWGWYPATWEAWVVLLVFLGLVFWLSLSVDDNMKPTTNQLVWFFVKEVVLIGILIAICFKTGEKPRWQWGPPKDTGTFESKKETVSTPK